jgi:predicted enzyme involved in methoxymalonyl-ACP biosynthesis
MQTQSIFIAHPETTEQINALQAFMKALKITFEISKQEEYNSEFVEKLLESRQQAKQGKVTKVKKENLREFLGL